MINLNFLRFDRSSKRDGFSYQSSRDPKDLDYDFQSVSMEKPGYTIHTQVRNYLAEAVMLGGNLRSNPTRINSLHQDGIRPSNNLNNYVIITILSSETTLNTDPKKRIVHSSKTEIRIPGKMLNQGSVFISELDCYIMTESQVDATRELIARDVTHDGWDAINIPATMIKSDPAIVYNEFKQLAKQCIDRQDKINIRVGVNLEYDFIPDSIRNMHVAIMDSYFVPFNCYKLEYDPTLGEDEFVIENLHLASRDEFRSTFSELNKVGVRYLDHDEVETLFGKFYGMALFANKTWYADYVHKRKSQERFRDETLYLAHRSGDPRLKEEIERLERDILLMKDAGTEQDALVVNLRETNKRLKSDLADRTDTLNKIRQHHDGKMSYDAVILDMTNEAMRIENETKKIGNERIDLDQREKAAPMIHRAAMLKTVGDILKSGWGITTACLGGVLSFIAVCKKYNVKITMAT